MSRQIGDIPTRTFASGDVIFREGDDAKGEAFLVHMGSVEIRKVVGGEDQLLNALKKGDAARRLRALSQRAPLGHRDRGRAVTLMVIPANRLDHMVRSNPALAMAIIRDLANRMLAAEERARNAESAAVAAEEAREGAAPRAARLERRLTGRSRRQDGVSARAGTSRRRGRRCDGRWRATRSRRATAH